MDAQVVEWVAAFSYPAVILLLVLCGLGVPLSEELIVITGGLVVARSSRTPGRRVSAARSGGSRAPTGPRSAAR